MRKKVGTLLGLLALVGVLGCESRTDGSAGGVILSITDFDGLPVQISVNNPAQLSIDSITIQNLPVNPNSGTTNLMNVEMKTYEIQYSRNDGGSRLPPPLVQGIFGVTPINGQNVYNNLPLLTAEQFTNPPLSDLSFFNGGVDTETGNQVIRLRLTIRFFGKTLTGDAVATAPATFDIEFVP